MHEITRDELLRFSVRLQVAKRLVGFFLLLGLALYALSAALFIGWREPAVNLVSAWYGMTAGRWELLIFLYFAALKGFFAGIIFPLWLSVLLAGRWVRRQLAA